MPSEPPLFALNSADLVEADEKVWEIGRFLPSIKCALSQAPHHLCCRTHWHKIMSMVYSDVCLSIQRVYGTSVLVVFNI